MSNNYYRGFVYTRNPIDGKNELYGKISNNYEFDYAIENYIEESFECVLKRIIPNIYEEFYTMCKEIENHFKDMQYIEFEILNDKIYITFCECAKRTAQASLKIACDMLQEYVNVENNDLVGIDCDVIDIPNNNKENGKNKFIKMKNGYKKYNKMSIKNDNRVNKSVINMNSTHGIVRKLIRKGNK